MLISVLRGDCLSGDGGLLLLPDSFSGERGIRTPDTLLRYTRFPGEPVQPLLHLSKNGAIYKNFYDDIRVISIRFRHIRPVPAMHRQILPYAAVLSSSHRK